MSVTIDEAMPGSLAGTSRQAALAARLQLPPERAQLRLRAVRDGLVIAGLMTSAFVLIVIPVVGRSLGYDAYAYWSIDLGTVYDRALGSLYALGAFRYAPPIAELLAPLHALPWWLFLSIWVALMVAALLYLGGRWSLALLALPAVALEFEHGNIHLLMAAAIVMGFRWPWTWSFVLLTKVTPGIGLIWFAVRHEWGKLGIALGFTAAVSIASWIVAPGLWTQWIATLTVTAGQAQDLSIPPPLPIRLPLAVLLVIWGARTDRPWTVGIAAFLALPVIWPHSFALALAAVPFLRRRADERRAADPRGARLRFISLRQLFGRDAVGDRPMPANPWLGVGLAAGCLAAAGVIALICGPDLRTTLSALSALIVPAGA